MPSGTPHQPRELKPKIIASCDHRQSVGLKWSSVTKTVLIVEDEFLIALDLALVLERDGWSVLGPVGTIEAAMTVLDSETPSIALLDTNLMDGPVTIVAETLKARNVPFVVASAHTQPELFAGDVLNGALNVGKPIDERRLLAALQRSLNGASD